MMEKDEYRSKISPEEEEDNKVEDPIKQKFEERNVEILKITNKHVNTQKIEHTKRCKELWDMWKNRDASLYAIPPAQNFLCLSYTNVELVLDISDTNDSGIGEIETEAERLSLKVEQGNCRLRIFDEKLDNELSLIRKGPAGIHYFRFFPPRIISPDDLKYLKYYDLCCIINAWCWSETANILQIVNIPVRYYDYFVQLKDELEDKNIQIILPLEKEEEYMTISFSSGKDPQYGVTTYTWKEITVKPPPQNYCGPISVTKKPTRHGKLIYTPKI